MTTRFPATPSLCGLSLATALLLLAGCGQQAATNDPAAAADATAIATDEAAAVSAEPAASYPRDELPATADGNAQASVDTGLTAPPTVAAPTPSPTTPATPAKPASSRPASNHPATASADQYAQVIAVKPVKRSVDTPREVCEEQTQTYARAPKDNNRIAGAVIGGVIGGVAGSQVGSGRGRDAATVAGAIGGVVAGRKIQEENQRRNQQTESRTETVCRTVTDSVEEVYAYDIDYEYGGKVLSARVDHDPGARIKLPVRSISE